MNTQQPVTEKQISSYLKYFNVKPEWLFNPENQSPTKDKWIKSCFSKFTNFGYIKDQGLVLKSELPDGAIVHEAFENVVSLSNIKDLESLTSEINRVKELQKINQRARAEKVSEVLNTFPPEKRTKTLETMKEGATELAKLQFIAQGKVDLHIADFSKETLTALSNYQQVRDEINQTIKRENELEQSKPDPEQSQER
jgi:hypothetical protein